MKLPVDGIPADMVIDERGVAWVAVDDDGVLWVPSEQDSILTRFDTRSGRRIGGPIDIGRNSAQLTASGGVVWVSGARDLIRVQP